MFDIDKYERSCKAMQDTIIEARKWTSQWKRQQKQKKGEVWTDLPTIQWYGVVESVAKEVVTADVPPKSTSMAAITREIRKAYKQRMRDAGPERQADVASKRASEICKIFK